MKKPFTWIILIPFLLSACSNNQSADVITRIDANLLKGKFVWKGGDYGQNRSVCFKINLTPKQKVNVLVDSTVRGNGGMEIGEQSFRILDGYEDGASYQDGVLAVEFKDVTNDGYVDLLINGVVLYTGEIDSEIYEQEKVHFCYAYDPDIKLFVLRDRTSSFDLMTENPGNKWWDRFYSEKYASRYMHFRDRDIEKGDKKIAWVEEFQPAPNMYESPPDDQVVNISNQGMDPTR